MKAKIIIVTFLAITLVSCIPMSTSEPTVLVDTPQPTKTLTSQPVITLLPKASETFIPTPTVVLNADSDGDGYLNSWELAWGTDPEFFTSFDDLLKLSDAITFTLMTRQPYDYNTVNLSPYQQMKLVSKKIIQDKTSGGVVEKPWETAEFQVVTFPYIVKKIDWYTQSLKIPYAIPENVKPYLQFTKTSNGCTTLDNVKPGGGTLFQLVQSWQQFNNTNLMYDPKTEAIPYKQMISMDTCSMVETGKRSDSTTMATLFVTYLRESGIPAAIAYGYDATDIDEELHNSDLAKFMTRSNNHPQVAVWTPDYEWIILDPNGGFYGARIPPYYVGIVFTALAPDIMDLNHNAFDGTGNATSLWVFYSSNLKSPDELLQYLHPDPPGY
jgi:hypothetical protein